MTSENDKQLYDYIRPIAYKEFDQASEFDTKAAIHLRAVQKIADALNIKELYSPSPSTKISVHPDVLILIEDLYKSLVIGDVKLDALTAKYSAFKSLAANFHEPATLKNLLKEFQKCLEINKDSVNKKDKVIKDSRLNILLAADGMQGMRPADLCNYIHHMSIGHIATKPGDQHVIGVRAMYSKIPLVLTGTDSTYLVAKVLLRLFAPHNTNADQAAMIQKEIKAIDDRFFKESQHYKELETVNKSPFLDELTLTYCDKVNEADLPHIAAEKLNMYWNHLKKKQQHHYPENRRKAPQKRPQAEQSPAVPPKKRK